MIKRQTNKKKTRTNIGIQFVVVAVVGVAVVVVVAGVVAGVVFGVNEHVR